MNNIPLLYKNNSFKKTIRLIDQKILQRIHIYLFYQKIKITRYAKHLYSKITENKLIVITLIYIFIALVILMVADSMAILSSSAVVYFAMVQVILQMDKNKFDYKKNSSLLIVKEIGKLNIEELLGLLKKEDVIPIAQFCGNSTDWRNKHELSIFFENISENDKLNYNNRVFYVTFKLLGNNSYIRLFRHYVASCGIFIISNYIESKDEITIVFYLDLMYCPEKDFNPSIHNSSFTTKKFQKYKKQKVKKHYTYSITNNKILTKSELKELTINFTWIDSNEQENISTLSVPHTYI